MQAAAKNVSSVTLELGGKSPTILDETANVEKAVKNLVWGKYLNTGQTCVAPDYALVHDSKKDEFIEALAAKMKYYYSLNPEVSNSFGRVVNQKHFNRLKRYINEAVAAGSKIQIGGNYNATDNYIEPTVISDLPNDSELLNDEVFGPILPVKTYKNLNEAIDFINSKEKPLAL